MHGTLLQTITNFILLTAAPLKHLGPWGYFAVFLIALIESTIVVGTFIPGSVGIIFAGLLIARGYYNFWGMLIVGSIGGVIGDAFSYYLGTKGEYLFKDEAKLLKKTHLERGKKFFERFGDKSILLGRFTGPIRPVMPFIAGLSEMDLGSFYFWNILSSVIWIMFHLSLGYFFGTSLRSIEKWSIFSGIILLVIVGMVVSLALLVQHRQKVFTFLSNKQEKIIKSLLLNTFLGQFINNHPKFASFTKNRFIRHKFSGLPLTILFVLFCYLLIIFAGIAEQITRLSIISNWDDRFLNFAIHLYNHRFAEWVIWFTNLGGEIVLPIVAVIVSCFLWYKKEKSYASTFIFTGIFAEVFNLAGKEFFHRLRPAAQLVQETTYSFPSGHATLSLAVYGFIIYLILRLEKKESVKTWSSIILGILIFLIGLSRLYLRVHYFSDVAGGFVLGGLCLVFGITLSEYFLSRKRSL
jgi:undecaprenyl-diphosphatase